MIQKTTRQRSNIRKILLYWVPVIFYCGLIVYLSSLSHPGQNLPSFFSDFSDKLVHGIEYGILGILLYRAFQHTTHISQSIAMAIFSATTFGISDELHQWYVPHRHADIWDVVADASGATLFILIWVFIIKK